MHSWLAQHIIRSLVSHVQRGLDYSTWLVSVSLSVSATRRLTIRVIIRTTNELTHSAVDISSDFL